MGQYQKGASRVRRSGEDLLLELRVSAEQLQQMLHEGLSGTALEIAAEVAEALLEDEVERVVGVKSRRDAERTTYRHGRQRGWINVDGAKTAIVRPRMRSVAGGEVDLATYGRLQNGRTAGVMRRLIRGVSCRNYRAVIHAIRRAAGVSATSVSRKFIEASEERIRILNERRFDGECYAAIFVDGVCFAGQTLVVALGVTERGNKRVLAMRQGATENAGVCIDLLEELRERGIDMNERRLWVLDGSKALRAAVRRVCGDHAEVQRCQQHKLRNVASYVPEQHWQSIRAAMQRAYAEPSYSKAKRMLETTARWLDRINPHAARSLREGLEESLTVTRLQLRGRLRSTFATTNPVEAVFGRVRTMTGRVKRWRGGTMRLRWCASALLHAEASFRAVKGCSEMSRLLRALGRQSAKLTFVA